MSRVVPMNTVFDPVHPPTASNNPAVSSLRFDRVVGKTTPTMLKSKEEVSPEYLFNTYWLGR